MDDPNIFEFDDFRLYLRAWFHSRRGRPSQARFATRVPCAKSLVTDILNGNKSLTRMLTPSFARELKLGRLETRYFETMVLCADGETAPIRADASRRRCAIQLTALNTPDVGLLIGLYQDWVRIAAYELARHPEFEASPDWVASRLLHPVATGRARDALRWLTDMGFIDDAGKPVDLLQAFSHETVAGNPDLVAASRGQHHQTIDLAHHALDHVPGHHRMYGAVTSIVSESRLDRIRELIRRYQTDLQLLITEPDQEPPTRVMHVGFQMFPLSRRRDGTESA